MPIQVSRSGLSAIKPVKPVKPVLMDFEEICQDHQRTLYLEAKWDMRNRLRQERFNARMLAMARRHGRIQARNVHNRRGHRRDSGISVSSTDTAACHRAATNAAATNTATTNTAAINTTDTNTAANQAAATITAHETHEEDSLSFAQYMEANPTELYQFHGHFTEALEADLAWTCNRFVEADRS